MRLALRELTRRPGRFLAATVILTLVGLLVMFLGGLLDGLVNGSTAAIRAQPGDVIVYAADAEATFQRSRIDADTRAQVESVDGAAVTGGLGVVQLGVRVPGTGPRELASTALFGYELAPDGVPDPPAAGDVYADSVLKVDGIEEGMEILLGPARSPVTVIGFVDDTTFSGQGSLWAAGDTWRRVLAANRPDQQLADGVFQALVVAAEEGVDAEELASRIDDATAASAGPRTETLTTSEAVEAVPGVSSQRTVFNQIIGVTIAIAVTVVGLFFALLTVERIPLYGVLKAVGGRNATLFGGLLLQAVVVTLVAVAVAAAASLALDAIIPPGSIPVDVTVGRIVTSAVLLLVAAVVGCAFSLRRVLRIDPASAIGAAA
jgi:putative ABC transport system permease protein